MAFTSDQMLEKLLVGHFVLSGHDPKTIPEKLQAFQQPSLVSAQQAGQPPASMPGLQPTPLTTAIGALMGGFGFHQPPPQSSAPPPQQTPPTATAAAPAAAPPSSSTSRLDPATKERLEFLGELNESDLWKNVSKVTRERLIRAEFEKKYTKEEADLYLPLASVRKPTTEDAEGKASQKDTKGKRRTDEKEEAPPATKRQRGTSGASAKKPAVEINEEELQAALEIDDE